MTSHGVNSRMSARSFLDTPVDMALVREILQLASRAPSGGNTQPWHVYVLTGEAKASLTAAVLALAAKGIMEEPNVPFQMYPPKDASAAYMDRRRTLGFEYYRLLGVAHDDTQGRLEAHMRNFKWFGAPVGLIVCVDKIVDRNGWGHVGMFLQTLCLLAVERGLATCCQEAWGCYPGTVAKLVNIPDSQSIWCGVSLGYADATAQVNKLRTQRVPLEQCATFYDAKL
jgi:nitroreductase